MVTKNKKLWIEKSLMTLINNKHKYFNIWKSTGCAAAHRAENSKSLEYVQRKNWQLLHKNITWKVFSISEGKQ